MSTLRTIAVLIGRVLLAAIFIISGLSKIGNYTGTAAYMASAGVPGILLPLVILLEVGGGLALVLGWRTRLAAVALAAFSLVAAFLFHNHWQDQTQLIMFLKNLAIAGGFLVLAAGGPGPLSLDARRSAA